MDVARAAHRGCVAKVLGGELDRLLALLLVLPLRARFEVPQVAEDDGAGTPRAERLGGVVRRRHQGEVGVDVAGADAADLVTIDVLQQALAGEVTAAAHDVGDTAVADHDVVRLARLAVEAESQVVPVDPGVLIAERRQTERLT